MNNDDTNAARCTDKLWDLGYSEAEAMGCDYPGEPAGVYARLICDGVPADSERVALRLIAQCVASCDACYGHCSVRPPEAPRAPTPAKPTKAREKEKNVV